MQKGGGDPWNWILKVLKWRNEIYQQIELKEYRWKTGVICLAILFISRVMVIKMSKMAYFLLMTAKI